MQHVIVDAPVRSHFAGIFAASSTGATHADHSARRGDQKLDSAPMRILIVEDNPSDAHLISELLSSESQTRFAIRHENRLSAAGKALMEADFDAVLLDLRLPDGSGLEAVQTVMEFADGTPIVVLTGMLDEELAVACIEAGAQDYIRKWSLDGDALRRAIGYAVARTRAEAVGQWMERADRLALVGKLAMSVAHEVNNPAAFIVANLHVMESYIKAAQKWLDVAEDSGVRSISEADYYSVKSVVAEMAEMVQDNLYGMEQICRVVRDLRDFATEPSEKVASVDLNRVVESACKLVSRQVETQASLIKNLRPVPLIAANQGLLAQLVVTLLLNASHAFEGKVEGVREIRVTTGYADGWLRVAVEDTGEAIVPEVLRRIFRTVAARGNRAQLRPELAICAEVASKHGGMLKASSQHGEGNRFELLLPLDTGMVAKPDAAQITNPPRALRVARILLVSDDVLIRKSLARLLRPVHYVEEATSVDVQQLSKGEFDLAICDFGGSPELRQQMKALEALKRPLIGLCEGEVASLLNFGSENGILAWFDKPVSATTLLAAIDHLLEEHERAERRQRDH